MSSLISLSEVEDQLLFCVISPLNKALMLLRIKRLWFYYAAVYMKYAMVLLIHAGGCLVSDFEFMFLLSQCSFQIFLMRDECVLRSQQLLTIQHISSTKCLENDESPLHFASKSRVQWAKW